METPVPDAADRDSLVGKLRADPAKQPLGLCTSEPRAL